MSHRVLRLCLIDGSSLGHAVVPRGFVLDGGKWSMPIPTLLPTGLPGELIPTTFRLECETRCQTTPADFSPGDRIAWEFRVSQTDACRTYWGDGHRCQLKRGHPRTEQHVCEHPDCTPYYDPIAYGPDCVYEFEAGG